MITAWSPPGAISPGSPRASARPTNAPRQFWMSTKNRNAGLNAAARSSVAVPFRRQELRRRTWRLVRIDRLAADPLRQHPFFATRRGLAGVQAHRIANAFSVHVDE